MNHQKKINHDLIVVLGPTASGKTQLAAQLAHQLNGEIISADSRQVYKGMDIGTGKDLNEYKIGGKKIPYHLIDIITPNEEYSVFQFQKDFQKEFINIQKRRKRPLLCGGTGLYIKSILMNFHLPMVPPNKKLRSNLKDWDYDKLIKKLDSISTNASKVHLVDTKRRIVRAIELELNKEKKVNEYNNLIQKIKKPLIIGIDYPREIIRDRITKRLNERIDQGMILEVENLLSNGISHAKLDSFGLEYRFISRYLEGKMNKQKMIEKLNIAIHQFCKRQMTFFRNMEKNGIKINWIPEGNLESALKIIKG